MGYRRQKFTFAISSPDEFLLTMQLRTEPWIQNQDERQVKLK